MTDEKLYLKWNDFQDIVKVSFAELRTDTDFTDVTLACEDQSIKVHKVVLSACSPFFKKLFKTHSHPQSLIYMKGMKANSLTAIIDFLYLGEANVFQEELDSFLALAEELQLEGFEGNSEETFQEHQTETFNCTEKRTNESQQQNRPERRISDVKCEKDANSEENVPKHLTDTFDHTETGAEVNRKQSLPERRIPDVDVKLENEETIRIYQQKPKLNSVIKPSTMEKIESMIEKRVDGYYCINCGHTSKKRDHVKEHVEKHIEGLEYPCNSCNKIMRSSNTLRCHKRRNCTFQNSSQNLNLVFFQDQ